MQPDLHHGKTPTLKSADPVPARDASEQAERPLRLLLAATLVFPFLLFVGAAWLSYDSYVAEAEDRLTRTLGIVHEHAAKIFETMELTAQYTDIIFATIPDIDLELGQTYYHNQLKDIVVKLPQLRDIWVINAEGKPLVSGTLNPMPPVNVSNREYFAVQRDNPNAGLHVSQVLDSVAASRRIFLISRRRPSLDGSFHGVMTTALAPEYFTEYYSSLPSTPSIVMSLLRSDGSILARYPGSYTANAYVGTVTDFRTHIAAEPLSAMYRGVSGRDGRDKLLTYRKLPRDDVYVLVAMDHDVITNLWISGMARHLIFGLPATAAMFAFAWVALLRTQRASRTHAQLRLEVAKREVTEQALRQAHKMEAVGRMTGGVAHDFNNLLTAILGNIDMAMRRLTPGNERVQKSLAAAREGSNRAATLVHRLLTFSRQHPQEVKAVDAGLLVAGMFDLMRRSLNETIEIVTLADPGIGLIAADPNQLENALLNLAVNARDAMHDGGRLTISVTPLTVGAEKTPGGLADRKRDDITPGDYIVISIKDTGIGMSADIIEQAFEPFFTTKPAGVGTGLGLSMAYGFVKQSGGHIAIASAPGKGTTIDLLFPRLETAGTLQEWRSSSQDSEEPAVAPAARNEFILLIEDDEAVAKFGIEALRELGYRVESAHDGTSAAAMFHMHPDIDLLFTDIVLPGGKNGREIAEEFRKVRPDLKVLYATGYTPDTVIQQGRLDADVEIMTKPYTADNLGQRVRNILDSHAKGRRTA